MSPFGKTIRMKPKEFARWQKGETAEAREVKKLQAEIKKLKKANRWLAQECAELQARLNRQEAK